MADGGGASDCGGCGAAGATQQCSNCKAGGYFDASCQRKAWKKHKKRCAPGGKERSSHPDEAVFQPAGDFDDLLCVAPGREKEADEAVIQPAGDFDDLLSQCPAVAASFRAIPRPVLALPDDLLHLPAHQLEGVRRICSGRAYFHREVCELS